MLKNLMALLFAIVVLYSCNNSEEKTAPITTTETDTKANIEPPTPVETKPAVSYTLLISKDSIKKFIKTADTNSLKIIALINRVDVKFLKRFDTIVIPSDFSVEIKNYFPFPLEAPFLENVKKIIFFSYPSQSFAAYENGKLVYTGPTSMGRKKDMTPTGLFYTNWKAEKSISTFNDEWELKWNFNIENKLGVGFHQYEMPGYPASHSCLRLIEKDAKFLYEWADQWTLKGTDNVLAKGTPVIVFGSYPFGNSKPWLSLGNNKNALDISVVELENTTNPFLGDVLKQQERKEKIK